MRSPLRLLTVCKLEVLDGAVLTCFVFRRLFKTRRTTDVERTHRQLRSGLANRLRGDNADRFADLNRTTSCEVAAVALDAATTT